jgi:hypothetical protein
MQAAQQHAAALLLLLLPPVDVAPCLPRCNTLTSAAKP